MNTYYATYHLHVKIRARDKVEAEKIARITRQDIGFDKAIMIEVQDDSLIVNLEKVILHE